MAFKSVLRDPSNAVARADAHARDADRLAVLERTDLLDAGIQESLQRFARLASDLAGAPVSLVSMVDAARQYFPAAQGLELSETALAASYCKHVAADDVQLCVTDSLQDDVLAENGATTSLGVRAYLGSPVTAGGARLGALCLLDSVPREWDDRQRRIVDDLAAAVSTDIQLRLVASDQARAASLDALTGLGNRRALNVALDRLFTEHRPAFVGVLDLDGFKGYNDRFGHPAGDSLLIRLADKLATAVGEAGQAFRMGGDEFCVVTHERERLDAARRALSEQGQGFCITASMGIAHVAVEASDPAAALSIADARLYGAKRARPGSVDQQVSAALVSALAERDNYLGGHSDSVADHVTAVAAALGLEDDAVRTIGLAARLHDIGKVAIPDSILTKAGPLSDEEWVLMRRHTLIGQRILTSAPALAIVGELIRSSHERYDGAGYPDGLAGDEIPLGARIICACDAFHAMIDERPYREARTEEEALEELRRCAGSQFDPDVVDAMTAALVATG